MITLIINIILATALISMILASIGCVVLWQKYIYFCDGIVHSCVLIGSVVVIFSLPIFISALIVLLIYSSMYIFLKENYNRSTAVSIISNGMFAASVLLINVMPNTPPISDILFNGEILFINIVDVIILFVHAVITAFWLYKNFRTIILMSLNKELAIIIIGHSVRFAELIFLAILTITVIIAMKMFGAMLLMSLLIIPAAVARIMSRSATQMIIFANLFALLFNFLGLGTAICFDVPIAATMVFINFVAFICTFLGFKILKRLN